MKNRGIARLLFSEMDDLLEIGGDNLFGNGIICHEQTVRAGRNDIQGRKTQWQKNLG